LGKFVNLVDLVDAGSTGKCASEFDSLEQLKEYTIFIRKFFPKESKDGETTESYNESFALRRCLAGGCEYAWKLLAGCR